MPKDPISQAVEAVGKKKAKVKKLEAEPTGTKAKKLDKGVMDALQQAFPKAKLAKVKVHTGGNTQELAKKLGARAFTQGDNIYFAKAGDATDKKMVAHELTHAVQQGNGKLPKQVPGKALTSK